MVSTTVILAVFAVITFSTVCGEETKVSIKLGTINGLKKKIEEKEVNVFLGIPYAIPPIGDLRFRKPRPIEEKWSKPLDATKWPKSCMQFMTFIAQSLHPEVSEDCLYLNVWTPVNLNEEFSQNLKPVMVYIHGGGFMMMSSSFKYFDASLLSSLGDVVIVTMNYRLGALGFLSSGTEDAPGNVGLYDQALALEWVQDNIKYFGGDPKKVTLFGESAGAWSVSLQFLSPISQDTFNRVIIQSGAVYGGVIVDSKTDAIEKALSISKLLGCEVNDGENVVTAKHIECLRHADATKIVEMQLMPQHSLLSNRALTSGMSFIPVSGEAFIPKDPNELLEQKSFNEGTDILVGTLTDEGQVMHFLLQMAGLGAKHNDWEQGLKSVISKALNDTSTEKIEEIVNFYFKNIDNKNSEDAEMAYYTALGDLYFQCETVYFADSVAKTNNLYQYLFDYLIQSSDETLPPCKLQTACHGTDIPLTFGTISHPMDLEVSKKWIKVLTDFAKTGTVEWPKHGSNSKPYYMFTGNRATDKLLNNFRRDACNLWKPILEDRFSN